MAAIAERDGAARDARGGLGIHPDTAGIGQWGAVQAVAPLFGVELTAVGMSDPGEIERSHRSLGARAERRP